ncbi:AAA family ATPase [Pseudomonas caricapapayae]|uniref:AAA family ATPase n=1 Tax=Pseudomonas caricapapayae TaxID=46678 RepID=UPI000EFEB17B|nr:response regulator [Pseudomonas caricapapayae]
MSQPPDAAPVRIAVFAANAPDAQSLEGLVQRLGEQQPHIATGGVPAALRWCAQRRAEVLLIDLDGEAAPLQALHELAERCEPECQVIALGSESDVDLYRALLHSGVVDYLRKPVRLDLLASTLERARSEHDGSFARTGRTLAVTACAGGLGTSSVASGIAQLLSTQRHTPVAVVDYDRHKSDQLVLLGVDGDAGLASALESQALDARLLQRAMLEVNPRLHLMAQSPVAQPAPVDTERLLNLGGNLCRLFNQVIWDLPAAHSKEMLEILRHSETRIVLTDLTVQGARSTQRLLEAIGDESDGQQLLLVENPVRGGKAPIEVEQFEAFLGRRLDMRLPHAGQTLAHSLLGGALGLDGHPALRQALLDLADLACGRQPQRSSAPSLLQRVSRALNRRAA